ncbi:MAG: hypothetical protein JWR06_560 [Jatrophihabitans sp.]|nr:hypothetical protein [Jatrophihabitans sp.]
MRSRNDGDTVGLKDVGRVRAWFGMFDRLVKASTAGTQGWS